MKRIALTLCLTLLSASASAAPLLGTRALDATAERSLASAVRAERAAHPDRFAAVADLQGIRPERYLSTRIRRPSVARELAALGRDALLPMLELLALRDYPRALSDDERATLEVALLEAVGALRDRRAAPVLRAAFETLTAPESLRAAARGLGALGTDDEIAALTAATQHPGARALAALEALGVARRDDATRTLIAALEASTDPEAIAAAARGLSEAGSTWGWAASRRVSELPARCAAALVRAIVRAPLAARDELQVAITAVAAPETLSYLADARARGDLDADARRRIASLERMVRRQLAR